MKKDQSRTTDKIKTNHLKAEQKVVLLESHYYLMEENAELLRNKVSILEKQLSHQTQTYRELTDNKRRELSMVDAKLKNLLKNLGCSDEEILDYINGKISLEQVINLHQKKD